MLKFYILRIFISLLKAMIAVVCALRIGGRAKFVRAEIPKKYAVGYEDIFVANRACVDLSIRVYYPGVDSVVRDSDQGIYSERYVSAYVKGLSNLLPGMLIKKWITSPTFAINKLSPLGDLDSKFPLVIFSHGYGGVNTQNTWLLEALASQGFVVASINHKPGSSMQIEKSGAKSTIPACLQREVINSSAGRVMSKLRKTEDTVTKHKLLKEFSSANPFNYLTKEWSNNLIDVINEFCTRGDSVLPLKIDALIDKDQIALIGMSLGGSASALAGELDERVKAVVNMDGAQFTVELINKEYKKPLLLLHSESAMLGDGIYINEINYKKIDSNSDRSKVERVILNGSSHLCYTDMIFFKNKIIQKLIGSEKIEPKEFSTGLLKVIVDFLVGNGVVNSDENFNNLDLLVKPPQRIL